MIIKNKDEDNFAEDIRTKRLFNNRLEDLDKFKEWTLEKDSDEERELQAQKE